MIRSNGQELIFDVVRTEKIVMSLATREFICVTARTCGKIPAIKFIRTEYKLGLKEAKDIVDWLCSKDTSPQTLGDLLRAKLDHA